MTTSSLYRTLKNSNGIEAVFSCYGATLTSLLLPVSEAEKLDVVLGFTEIEEYEASFRLPSPPFLGAVVGLHAGRLKNGTYKDGDHQVQLEKNLNGKHHIHGGSQNLSKQFWTLISENNHSLTYELHVNEGKTKVEAGYSLDDDNTLRVSLTATTEENVLVNLTQHSYFNLCGHKGDVTDLKMKVNASRILETDGDLIPTGSYINTKGGPLDFSEFKNCPSEIDLSFVLDGQTPAAILENEQNGWSMKVETNQPSVHIFIGGAHCLPLLGKQDTPYHKTSGICFEAQNFPDSPNHPGFRNGILKPGQVYRNDIAFSFINKIRTK